MGISTELLKDFSQKIEASYNNIDFFRDQIVLSDAEKEIYDAAIFNLDTELISEIDEINNYYVGVQSAYQERVNVGCRTDMFWTVVGIDTTLIPPEYSIRATKISLTGYENDPSGIGTVGVGTTGLAIFTASGIATIPRDSLYGFAEDNLWGLKYYNEPYLNDIGNTSVATFIGTVGIGQTTLVVMLPYEDGISDLFSPGQLVISNKDNIFGGGSNVIAGLGTTATDLSIVSPGIGTTSTVVPTILLETATVGIASAPEADGSFVSFTVLDDPNNISSISDYAVPFTASPFSPQTIGIMNGSQIGIGKSIFFDNSGNPSGPQSWRPENEVQGVEDVDDVVEPSIGAGKIYYTVGFTSAPSSIGVPVAEGTIITGVTDATSTLYFSNLPTCSTEEAALAASIVAKDNAVNAFNSGIATSNLLIDASTLLREERDLLSLKIWGLRQAIGQEIDNIGRYDRLNSYIGITTVSNVIT